MIKYKFTATLKFTGEVIPRKYISDDFEFKLVIDSPSPDLIQKYFLN